LFHRPDREVWGDRGESRECDSGEHPEPGGDEIVGDCGDSGEFHGSLRASGKSAGGGCALAEWELNAAWAA
jgi:hypothetical protein